MEMDPHERDSDIGDDSPMSHNEEELSDPEVDGDLHEGGEDSCDEGGMRMAPPPLGPSIPTDHHPDVLAKLKMQVRDLKEREELEQLQLKQIVQQTHHANGGGGGGAGLALSLGGGGGGMNPLLAPLAAFPFPHPAVSAAASAFLPPLGAASVANVPPSAPPSSGGSSHSSEGSASSQHTWSFEEQFKQVRQLQAAYHFAAGRNGASCRQIDTTDLEHSCLKLYEINDDPKRKEFLDDLFSFMQKRGTPINRLPIMAKSVLDLYELYNLVIARGGLVDVINKKLWQEIIKGLHLPSSITSAAFTLRTQYMKYLYPYECEKRRLSTPAELQAAIDGNRREGRRSSYGTYTEMVQRSPIPTSQMSPLSLVTQQQSMAARIGLTNGVHHPSHPPPLGQQPAGGPIPGLAPAEFEARMVEYVKLLNKELRNSAGTPPRQGSSSPPGATSPLNALEMSRLTLWNLYNNNSVQPEPQREALNLSEATQHQQPVSIKREPDRDVPPPAKRLLHDEEMSPPPAPATPTHIGSASTNIKITNRGDARNGDNSLVVSMELNGVMYQGVLFAQQAQSGTRRITT